VDPVVKRRAELLIEVFDAAQPRWLSLDVFDTLLWRTVHKPVDVFPSVARALALDAEAFARARVDAEKSARRRHPSGEICIEDLCAELSAALGGSCDAAALIEAELAAERACMRLDHDIGALVLHAARQGVSYVLVSDMYLRAAHLLELVRAASRRVAMELPPPAHVFVSGERRTNKASGMFDLVLDTLGCPAAEVLHVGDHPEADVDAAARRGMRVFHYRRESEYGNRVFARERRRRHRAAADFGLDATRAKAALTRQGAVGHFEYGALVLGPLLAAFAEWVAVDCASRRQRRVYCLMREGHLIAPLVARAARALDIELDVRTLWASRYALRGAAFQAGNEAEMRGYFAKRHRVPLTIVARDLGVDLAALRGASGVAHDRGLDEAEVRAVSEALVRTPPLQAQLLAAAAAKRRRLMAYFEAAGVFDGECLAIVDLGWAGTLQKLLARLLAASPAPREIRGLYFATHGGLLDMELGRCSAESFLFHLGMPPELYECLSRTPEIIENACMPATGSFRGIDEAGRPEHFAQLLPAAQLADIAELQLGVERFAGLWLPGALERRSQMSHADWQRHLDRLRGVLARSLQEPLPEEVALFRDWQHESNDGSATVEPLLGSEALRSRARRMSYRQIRRISWLDCYWPHGLACLVGKTPGVAWPRLFGRNADG
jgi:predicted HAD superfamily hydrolase